MATNRPDTLDPALLRPGRLDRKAGMFAIRARRKVITEKDMIEAVNKVVKGYAKLRYADVGAGSMPMAARASPRSTRELVLGLEWDASELDVR
ncbi:hypothetical protein T492DRAFT_892685 [Pavlovales sp. CCMP2436]|nr:hypothetical protein T492DRAFT_892685 [Pavlovales sp. CCMP2436]